MITYVHLIDHLYLILLCNLIYRFDLGLDYQELWETLWLSTLELSGFVAPFRQFYNEVSFFKNEKLHLFT